MNTAVRIGAMVLGAIGLVAGAWFGIEAHDRNEAAGPGNTTESASALATASSEMLTGELAGYVLDAPITRVRAQRPALRRGTDDRGAGDTELWEEDLASGARVYVLVARDAQRVRRIQVAGAVRTVDDVRARFATLEQRFGRPTGVHDCPESAEASPMRRYTWRRPQASVMEAVLVHPGGVAMTTVYASNGDIAEALARAGCRAVTDPDAQRAFPVASEIRGQQTPLVRPVPPR